MNICIGKMDRNGDGYIDIHERELGIRKAILKLNRKIDKRNCRNGYGYDDYCFRNRPRIAQNPYLQQAVLSQYKMLAFFQQIMNNMMNMFRTMMNQQFAQQYGQQYGLEDSPYDYCPTQAQQIYGRGVDPRTLVQGTPARVPVQVAPQAVAPQVVAPQVVAPQAVAPQTVAPQTVAPQVVAPQAVAPQTVAPTVQNPSAQQIIIQQATTPQGTQTQQVIIQNPAQAPVAKPAPAAPADPYDGYAQDETSDAALFLQQDIANKDSEIENLVNIYNNGDYDRAEGGQEKIEAEIQKLKNEREALKAQYNATQNSAPAAAQQVAQNSQVINNVDIDARIAELNDKLPTGNMTPEEYEELDKLNAKKADYARIAELNDKLPTGNMTPEEYEELSKLQAKI